MSRLACGLLVLLAACGGDGSGPTPTNPAPIPGADACDLLGGTASTSGTAILNGTACSTDRSSVVRLNMKGEFGDAVASCTGTVVAPRAVLTAAHCLDQDVVTARVWLGSGPEIVAESFVFYPDFRFNVPGSFDVGVVLLADDVPRRPFSILISRDGRVGEPAIVAGWGRNQNNETATLRAGSTTLSVVTGELLRTLVAPPSSSVCAGDSGGPILLSEGGTWAIAGITSATSRSGCNEGENIYQAVRHPAVRDFIIQHVPEIAQR